MKCVSFLEKISQNNDKNDPYKKEGRVGETGELTTRGKDAGSDSQ